MKPALKKSRVLMNHGSADCGTAAAVAGVDVAVKAHAKRASRRTRGGVKRIASFGEYWCRGARGSRQRHETPDVSWANNHPSGL